MRYRGIEISGVALCRHCGKAIAHLNDEEPPIGWLHFTAFDDGHDAEPKKWLREDW